MYKWLLLLMTLALFSVGCDEDDTNRDQDILDQSPDITLCPATDGGAGGDSGNFTILVAAALTMDEIDLPDPDSSVTELNFRVSAGAGGAGGAGLEDLLPGEPGEPGEAGDGVLNDQEDVANDYSAIAAGSALVVGVEGQDDQLSPASTIAVESFQLGAGAVLVLHQDSVIHCRDLHLLPGSTLIVTREPQPENPASVASSYSAAPGQHGGDLQINCERVTIEGELILDGAPGAPSSPGGDGGTLTIHAEHFQMTSSGMIRASGGAGGDGAAAAACE